MNSSVRFLAARDAMAIESLHRGGFLRLRVRGQSMLPSIWPGDIVEVQACALRNLKPGDVVLAFRENRFILHRFVADSDRGFVLRGDSMPSADPAYPADALLGKAIRVERSGRCAEPSRLGLPSRILGIVFCRFSWARQLALKLRQSMKAAVANSALPNDVAADVCQCEAP